MDRDINSLYSDIFETVGGSPQNKVSKKGNTKINSYIPSDIDPKDNDAISKLFKINRLLKEELRKTKEELTKTKQMLQEAKKR